MVARPMLKVMLWGHTYPVRNNAMGSMSHVECSKLRQMSHAGGMLGVILWVRAPHQE
jgi:hypothetical protein